MRFPRPWVSREERDADRFEDGRQAAFARAMRQNADRDRITQGSTWRSGPVGRPRQIRRTERTLQQSRDPSRNPGHRRAAVLARAMDQAIARDRRSR